MKKFKRRNIMIGIIIVAVILTITIGIVFSNKSNNKVSMNVKVKEKTFNYTAYIKINPLIKISFTRTCTYNGKKKNCTNPIVKEYELINDDAKFIYKDINLLASTKKLNEVLLMICKIAKDKNILFTSVDIYSNWSDMENYISKNKDKDITWSYNFNFVNEFEKEDINNLNTNITYTVKFDTEGPQTIEDQLVKLGNKVQKPKNPTKDGYTFVEWQLDGKAFNFDTLINSDIILKVKWEEVKSLINNSINTTEFSKPEDHNNSIINLNDNVIYTLSTTSYKCKSNVNDCISQTIIDNINNSLGYNDCGSDYNILCFESITLWDKYNNAKYYGNKIDFEKNLLEAGARLNGFDSKDNLVLDEDTCNKFKLSCNRW